MPNGVSNLVWTVVCAWIAYSAAVHACALGATPRLSMEAYAATPAGQAPPRAAALGPQAYCMTGPETPRISDASYQ